MLLENLRKIKNYFVHYDPSVKVFISKTRLVENLKEYQSQYPKLLFAPVLKSNAYGHGLVQVARILDKEDIAFLVVDSLHEAMILRSNGIKSEILVIGYTQAENIKNTKLSKISFTIISLEQLEEVISIASSKVRIHLKIDTGMHRQGVLPDQINRTIELIKTNKFFVLEGICSHFADADSADETLTKKQIEEWEKIALLFQKKFQTIKFYHISATSGSYFSGQTRGNVARLGIGLYGINPSPFVKLNLKPVLRMQSVLSSLKHLKAGERVGYNFTYQLKKDSIIATVPVGYFEGIDRRLSNRGFLKIKNNYCPILGRVCMNITSIDVTSLPKIQLGDYVEVISDNASDKNSIVNMASLSETIPYEILAHLPQGLRRIVV